MRTLKGLEPNDLNIVLTVYGFSSISIECLFPGLWFSFIFFMQDCLHGMVLGLRSVFACHYIFLSIVLFPVLWSMVN